MVKNTEKSRKQTEDILDGVIERITDRLMRDAGDIVRQKELPVLERLMGMTEGSLQEAILTIFRGSRLGSDGN